jgi:hypothetical protein
MTDDAIRESMVKRFHTIPGLGMSKAGLLFDAGYTTISSLQKADSEVLSKVKGISPPLARFIIREVKGMSEEAPSEMVSCSMEMTATTKPGDADSASIKVDHEPAGSMGIGKPTDDVKVDGEGDQASTGQPGDAAAKPSSGGIFSGLINSFKSLFGGGKAEPAPTEAKPDGEEKPAESSTEAVTIKEDTAEAKPVEKAPEATGAKAPSDATISVDHKDEPKAEVKPEPKKEPEAKIDTSKEPKPVPKKGGENEKLVEDIIKELDLDKEHR